jgi:ubiquitin
VTTGGKINGKWTSAFKISRPQKRRRTSKNATHTANGKDKKVAQMATFSDSKIAANSCSPKYSMCLPICFTHYSFKTFTQMQ